MSEVYTFEVIEGEHVGKHQTFRKGDKFKSNKPLDKMFSEKFRLISENAILSDVPVIKKKPVVVLPDFNFVEADEVTELFPIAGDNGLRIFRNSDSKFAVIDNQVELENALNLAPSIMSNKAAVTKWLNKYLETNNID
jgi:hypothetical protein